MKEKRKKINEEITSENVQVITDNGENLGEMKLSDALAKAKEQNLDLLEMSQNKDKSIAKIIDYGKYLYRQKKQTQKQRAQGKSPDLKTIRITFKIGDHDLQVKRKQAEKFASGGHSLKISLMLRGRENHYSEIAEQKIQEFVQLLEDIYKPDGPVKKSGNVFNVILKPRG